MLLASSAVSLLRLCLTGLVTLMPAAPPQATDLAALRALVDNEHYKRARTGLEAWVSSHPSDAEGFYLLSKAREAFHDFDAALTAAERATSLAPKNGAYRYQLAAVVGQQASEAGVLRQFGLARRFKKEAEAALALDSSDIDARAALMEYHLRAPGIVGGDSKIAQQMLTEIQKLNPARGYLAEATYWRLTEKKDPTEPLFVKAAAAAPNDFTARFALARSYTQSKKFDEAEKALRESIRLAPDRSGPYSVLCYIYASSQRWKELDATLADAERVNADDLMPYYQVAFTLNKTGTDLARAERAAQKYLSIAPEPNAPKVDVAKKLLAEIQAKLKKKIA